MSINLDLKVVGDARRQLDAASRRLAKVEVLIKEIQQNPSMAQLRLDMRKSEIQHQISEMKTLCYAALVRIE